MSEMQSTLSLNLSHTALWYAMTAAGESGLPAVLNDSWVSDAESLSEVLKTFIGNDHRLVIWRDDRPGTGYQEIVFKTDDAVLRVSKERRDFNCSVFSESYEKAQDNLIVLHQLLPAAERQEKLLDVTFWYSTTHGPRRYDRQLQAPAWREVEGNYPPATREKIAALQTVELAEGSGKLILWQGEPGTGKTFALRALGEEWAAWCRIHYVLDPEKFFTEGDYLLNVILEEDGSLRAIGSSPDVRPAWRLIVLEDAGEMLAKDAKLQVGQGLARLLNLCDGLLGQGLRVLVLITTNEQVGTLHTAVSRPGRCLSQIVFEKFDVASANQWLRARGSETSVINATPLADLYAIAQGGKLPDRKVAGFK